MPYIGNTPALDYISYAVQNFTVTAGTTVYTLDYSVSNENDIRLVINNVIQRPGASYAYSATGTTLTLTSATLSTDTMYAVFIGRAVQTVTPPANINLQLADGTAAAPSLNFANDTNTGLYRATTDTLGLVTGGTERVKVNSSGNVQFAGNIGLGGTTPTTSGTGITFPGTQSASTDANTLDDYEEGTFDVTLTPSTSGSITLSSSQNLGSYTKVGRLVTIMFGVLVSSVSSPTGAVQINLPFNPASGSERDGWGAPSFMLNNTTGSNLNTFVALLEQTNNILTIYKGASTSVTADSAQAFTTNTELFLTFTYKVS